MGKSSAAGLARISSTIRSPTSFTRSGLEKQYWVYATGVLAGSVSPFSSTAKKSGRLWRNSLGETSARGMLWSTPALASPGTPGVKSHISRSNVVRPRSSGICPPRLL